MASVIRDMWTSERIQRQFYNKNPLLEKLRAAAGTKVDQMGLQAQVPIQGQRAQHHRRQGP
jgi:hypothetical protein